MNDFYDNTESTEHVLKGLKRYRYKKPEESLEEVRTGMRRWCWEYLRLSKDYWMVCQTSDGFGRIATQDRELSSLYRKFGNVHNCTFDEWWINRGYRVFSEKEKFPKVKLIPSRPNERISQHPSDESIWVEIPIKLSKRTVQKQIGKLLNEYESIRPRSRMELSSAGLKFNSVQFGTHTLKKVHEVYALHRELILKPKWIKQNNPNSKNVEKADLFRIGKLLKLSPSNEYGNVEELAKKHNRMRVAVSRNLKNARLLIKNLESGIFPSYAAIEPPDNRFTARQLAQHKDLEEKWWSLNLISDLSIEKLKEVKAIHYEEPEHIRQDILIGANEKRIINLRDA